MANCTVKFTLPRAYLKTCKTNFKMVKKKKKKRMGNCDTKSYAYCFQNVEVIYQTRDTVFNQTPRRELKIRYVAEYF